MKVKISGQSVTFKISEDEMNQLLCGNVLQDNIHIGTNCLCLEINLQSREYFDDVEDIPIRLILDRSESCLMLCTTQDEIRKLAEMGKDRTGIAMKRDNLEIRLQVDVRDDTRPRRP